jgi:hypothetical protein
MKLDEQMHNFLDGVKGIVDANSYEYHCLWESYSQTYKDTFLKHGDDGRIRYTWIQNLVGLQEIVGWLDERPVNLSLYTAVIDGHKILFFDPVSQVVDWKMVDKWLEKTMPDTARRSDGYLNRTNAMNFSNVLHDIRHRMKKSA